MNVYEGPKSPTHGLASTYRKLQYRCRCEACSEAHRSLQRVEAAARRERLAADPSLAQHGRAATYSNWGCRCEACSAAMAEKKRRYVSRAKTSTLMALLVAVALAAAPAAQATPGVEDIRPCVTDYEYDTIDDGSHMPRAEAERILDGRGRSAHPRYDVSPSGEYGVETWKHRTYRGCIGLDRGAGKWTNSVVHVFYTSDNRVKWAYWWLPCVHDCTTVTVLPE